MKNLSITAKVYVLGVILLGLGLIGQAALELDWTNPGLYVLAVLGAVAQTLKLEGPNNRTNYSIAWFVYGFGFMAYGPAAALFVVVISHLVEWTWHKYAWYIQGFNIGAHVISVFLAGLAFETVSLGTKMLGRNSAALGMIAANLIFVLLNHFLVGLVVKFARGQSFVESGVFEFLTLFIDFTVLIWNTTPLASLLNILPLYLLYNALRVPALKRQLQEAHG
jgi:hypothetical protein